MLSAFIIVVGVLVYAWILYPAVVLLLRRKGGASHVLPLTSSLPPVAILFSAHNEESVILKRLENLAELDYPAERLQIFVGVDGGNDRTAEIALAWAKSHPNVHVVVSPTNHGKTAMLKHLVGEVGGRRAEDGEQRAASVEEKSIQQKETKETKGGDCDSAGGGEVNLSSLALFPSVQISSYSPEPEVSLLVFTDANTFFKPDALRELVAPFVDSKVGGVCGRLVLEGGGQRRERGEAKSIEQKTRRTLREENGAPLPGTDESIYWDLETRLKAAESALDSCVGANGAIYAIRAELFPSHSHFPENTIIDDFVIGMKVREQGYRFVYEVNAVATEELPAMVKHEWRRRVRIGAGAYQALALCWRCLLPSYGAFAWMFWSHKVLRWFTPHLGILAVGIGVWLLLDALLPFRKESWGEGIFLLISAVIGVGVFLVSRSGRKVFKLSAYFITMQAALFVGFLRYCRGGLKGSWARTERGR